jgi:hypothetical protein
VISDVTPWGQLIRPHVACLLLGRVGFVYYAWLITDVRMTRGLNNPHTPARDE